MKKAKKLCKIAVVIVALMTSAIVMSCKVPSDGGVGAADMGLFPDSDNIGKYTVILESFEIAKKIPVIKVIRTYTGLHLGEAKALVEDVPSVVKENISESYANEIVSALKDAGGIASKK